jgi:hypothetical protein
MRTLVHWLLAAGLAVVVGAMSADLACLASEQQMEFRLAASPLTEVADVDLPTAFEVSLTEPPAYSVLTQ